MSITEFPLGEWTPDLADYKNAGLTVCDGCYPSAGGYGPFLAPNGSGINISGDVRGAMRFLRANGQVVVVVGTDGDLHTIIGGIAAASGLSLSLGSNVYWTFERYGSQVWAFAYGQTPHYIDDIELGSTFTPHPGVAPKAASGNRVSDFIVTGNMVDIDDSVQPYRIRWSKFNDPAGDYGTDIATQSGYVDMPQAFGPVIGVFGGRSNVVLQKYGVSRLAYTGGASAFAKEVIEEESGCVSRNSVCTVGSRVYYLGSSGFMVTDGSSVASISAGRVFEWFMKNADPSSLEFVQGAVNWHDSSVVWSFTGAGSVGYTRQIIYSWEHDRWSTASIPVDWMLETNQTGLSLEQVAAIYTDLDAMTASLDSPEFKAADRSFAAFIDGEYSPMTGNAVEAVWETGEIQPKTGYRVSTREVRPLVENQNTNATIAIGSREVFKGDTISWTDKVAVGAAGFAPVIKDGRYLRAQLTIPAAAVWDKAIGIQVDYIPTGKV